MIRFSQTRDGVETSVQVPDELNYLELVSAFRSFSLAIGFHPDTVNESLGEPD